MENKAYALTRAELIRVLTVYTGITTSDGAEDRTTLMDSRLKGKNDFISGKTILLMSGDAKYEDKGALSFDNETGQITLESAVSAQIKAGTIFRVLNISSVETLIKDIEAKLDTGGLGVGLVTKALTFNNDTGQVNLFTVTGDVIVRIVAVVKTNCASVGGCNVSVGIATDVDAIIPVTNITLLAAQEIWHDATPDSEVEALGTMREHIITDGNDVTLNSDAADNSGAITFYCLWTALSSGASVVAA